MQEEVSNLKGLDVYTPDGVFVGKVDRVTMDVPNKRASGLFIEKPSPVLVDDGLCIRIPYRWVQSVGDIIILKAFPSHVHQDSVE
jgi:sporulation protein YlmC with PRC-barrel domain